MLGLALEGGGAKGAFHMGVVKAFLEEGYTFEGITGTSIGALNGALIAQGDFYKCYELWEGLEPYKLFDIDYEEYYKLVKKNLDKEILMKIALKARNVIRNKGLNTSKMRNVIDSILDEDKLRKSPVDFGLVTVSLTDFKPLELFKEDIPGGMMSDLLFASSNLPVFDSKKIKDKYYLDGGFYDNCPINLLARKGYRNIVAVRTKSLGINQKIKYPDLNIIQITPAENLEGMLDFSNESIQKGLKLGYYAAMRHLKGLKGFKYYIEPLDEQRIFDKLLGLSDAAVNDLAQILGVSPLPPKRLLFEKIIPEVASLLKLDSSATYQDIIIKLFEALAEDKDVCKYQIYSFSDFFNKIKTKQEPKAFSPAINLKLPISFKRKSAVIKVSQYICDLIDL